MTYICCTHHGDLCEWSGCDFSSANSICKHSCVLSFSARISLTLFLWRGDSGKEISTRWCCVKEINLSCDSWLVSRNDVLQKAFMPIASTWIVSWYFLLFSWETLHSSVLSLTTKPSLCLFKPRWTSEVVKNYILSWKHQNISFLNNYVVPKTYCFVLQNCLLYSHTF